MEATVHLYRRSGEPADGRVPLERTASLPAGQALLALAAGPGVDRDAAAAAVSAVVLGAPIAVVDGAEGPLLASAKDRGDAFTTPAVNLGRFRRAAAEAEPGDAFAEAVAAAGIAVVAVEQDEVATEWRVYARDRELGSTLYERALKGVGAAGLLREMAREGVLNAEVAEVLGRSWGRDALADVEPVRRPAFA